MEGMTPGPAPTSAPSAPTSAPSAPSGITGVPPTSNAPAPPSGMQAEGAPPEAPKPRFPWKTKARVGEAEHELELDLAEYRHRVKVDGEELEVPFEDLGKSYERVRASMKRFDEASKLKREAEQREQALGEKMQRLEQTLSNPQSAARVLKKVLGEEGFYSMLADELAQRVEYEKLPPQERQAYDQRSQREQQIAQRESALARREAEAKRLEEQRVGRLAQERQQQLVAEWVPALEAAGLPAKINGQPNGRMIAMLAETLRTARANKVPLTLREAVGMVREEYDALVSHAQQQRQQQTVAALEAQPGRMDPAAPTTPAAAPRQRQQRMSAADFQRELNKTWQR
jgi:hypothetical protein